MLHFGVNIAILTISVDKDTTIILRSRFWPSKWYI